MHACPLYPPSSESKTKTIRPGEHNWVSIWNPWSAVNTDPPLTNWAWARAERLENPPCKGLIRERLCLAQLHAAQRSHPARRDWREGGKDSSPTSSPTLPATTPTRVEHRRDGLPVIRPSTGSPGYPRPECRRLTAPDRRPGSTARWLLPTGRCRRTRDTCRWRWNRRS